FRCSFAADRHKLIGPQPDGRYPVRGLDQRRQRLGRGAEAVRRILPGSRFELGGDFMLTIAAQVRIIQIFDQPLVSVANIERVDVVDQVAAHFWDPTRSRAKTDLSVSKAFSHWQAPSFDKARKHCED